MIYQLKINLAYMKPPIWRRVEITSDTSLEDLHKIIQSTMGWDNIHLHDFEVDNISYVPPCEAEYGGESYVDVFVKDVLKREKDKISYTYDFGDNWQHIILLEKIKEKENSVNYPRCIKGKGGCPPEDCGGDWDEEDVIPFDMDDINNLLQKDDFGVISLDF